MKKILLFLFSLIAVLCAAQEPWKEHSFKAFEAYQAHNYEEACRLAYIAIDEGVGDAIPSFYMILSECEMKCMRGDKAKSAAENAGKRGVADGYYIAGMLCLDSERFNATKDINKGLEYLSIADKMGYINATQQLADCYGYGNYGVTENKYEYFKLLQKLVDNGDVLSIYNVGWCYESGSGVAKDLNNAQEYYLKLVEKGVYLGYNQMGYCNAYNKKYADAYRWIDRGIELYNKKGASQYDWDWTIDNLYDSKGDILLMEGKYDEAIPIYNRLRISKDVKIQESAFIKKMQAYFANDVDKVLENNVKSTNVFALIIANEKYMRVDNVSFALNDGLVVREYCQKTLGIPSANIVYVEDASRNDLVYSISQVKRLVVTNNAKLIVYYAGHGIPDEASRTAYLLPVDGYGTDVSTGYSLDLLYKELGELPSQNIVFLDACFSGAKREGGMLAEARGVAIKSKPGTPQGNTIVLSAAQGDETALPYKEKYHGMFTYFLLKKIKESKGNTSIGELSDYLYNNVTSNSILVNNKSQTPSVISSIKVGDSWRMWNLK